MGGPVEEGAWEMALGGLEGGLGVVRLEGN